MAKKKSQRRDWRMIIFLMVSVMIVLFMVLGAILPALLARGLCAPLPPFAPGSHPRPPCADVPLSAHCRTEGVLPALMPPISLPQR